MPTCIAGIDWSIAGPSICIHPKDMAWDLSNCKFLTIDNVKKNQGFWFNDKIEVLSPIKVYSYDIERFSIIADKFITFLNKNNCEFALFEAYAYGGSGKVFNLAESTGLMKHALTTNNISWSGETPPVFKKYATGKGNSNKDIMHDFFVKDTGVDFIKMFNQTKLKSPADNLVDSYFICKYQHEQTYCV